MRSALQRLGVVAWWAVLPGLIVYLRGKPRTRVLIRSGGGIVVVKGWLGNGKWTLPGGGLHRSEAPLAGLLRETREETGVLLPANAVRAAFTETYNKNGIVFPCHYFAAELPEQTPLRPQLLEICEAAWVDPAVCTPQNSNQDVLLAIAHAAGQAAKTGRV